MERLESRYLHLSDVNGFYVPHQSVWKEGVIPGEGRIGEENFKGFINYVGKEHSDAKLCVEVDNTDFKKMDESAEAIRRIVGWLG